MTGADGFLVADPLQYLDWARQAGEHGLIGNRHDLAPGDRAFLHPGLLLSGLAWRLGAGPARRLPALEAGRGRRAVRRDARRSCGASSTRRDDRRLALVLALFACSPVAALVGWGGLGDAGRQAAGRLHHGRAVVGLLPVGLPVHGDRRRAAAARRCWPTSADARRRRRWRGAAAAGLLCAWLQPWQGATFAFVLAGAELVELRRGRPPARARRATSRCRSRPPPLPLVYYALLGRFDASWALAGARQRPAALVVVGAARAGSRRSRVPAAFAYRLPAPDFGAVALRVWPLAALLVYFQPFGTFPFHALQGLTPPLVVLGVLALRARLGERPIRLVARGRRRSRCWWCVGTAYRVGEPRRRRAPRPPAVHARRPGERAALRHLDALAEPGGVLAPVYTGIAVPAYTGRETWIGAGSWTPRPAGARPRRPRRCSAAGSTRPRREALVRRSGARFVLSDCHGRADIARAARRASRTRRAASAARPSGGCGESRGVAPAERRRAARGRRAA